MSNNNNTALNLELNCTTERTSKIGSQFRILLSFCVVKGPAADATDAPQP